MPHPIPRHLWMQSLRQLTIIVLAAVAIALISNQFRPDRLPLVESRSPETRLISPSGRQLAISLDEAKSLYMSGNTVFMDARSLEEYTAGHIQGAVSLPWHDAEQKAIEIIGNLPNDTLIIAYCDGATCNLSKELALFLENFGFSNVRVLVNGWSVWKEAGLPIETGK